MRPDLEITFWKMQRLFKNLALKHILNQSFNRRERSHVFRNCFGLWLKTMKRNRNIYSESGMSVSIQLLHILISYVRHVKRSTRLTADSVVRLCTRFLSVRAACVWWLLRPVARLPGRNSVSPLGRYLVWTNDTSVRWTARLRWPGDNRDLWFIHKLI